MNELAQEPESSVAPEPVADGATTRRLRLTLEQTPLRSKLFLLLTAAVAGGVALGTLAAGAAQPITWLMLGLPGLVALVCALAQGWVNAPLDRLLEQLSTLTVGEDVATLSALPVQRCDEVGQIAQAVHHLGALALQHQYEVRRLRRTIDCEITRATRQSTRQLRRMALRDPLTDLGNRRFVDEHLEPVVQLVRQAQAELIALMIDVDEFKHINDTYGHAEGDKLLTLLGSIIRATTRHDDLAARLGGDEFAIFLPGAGLDRAVQLSELVRSMFCQQVRTMHPGETKLNLSIGVALLQRDGCATGAELLGKADAYLYQAKRAGKGQTWGIGDV